MLLSVRHPGPSAAAAAASPSWVTATSPLLRGGWRARGGEFRAHTAIARVRGGGQRGGWRHQRACSGAAVTVCSLTPTQIDNLGVQFDLAAGKAAPAVALGKFDALHLGHRALVKQAAALGAPYLVSFSGMAEVFNWPATKPTVAPPDRARVLRDWSAQLGTGAPIAERVFPFSEVRGLSPEDFVLLLAELGVKGVVAGSNYRFGYKAAGNAKMLEELGHKYNMDVSIVEMVNDDTAQRVSSTRIRGCLVEGRVDEAAALLGRRHRCVADLDAAACRTSEGGRLSVPRELFLNWLPADGTYKVKVGLERAAEGAESAAAAAAFVEQEVHVSEAAVGFVGGTLVVPNAPCRVLVEF